MSDARLDVLVVGGGIHGVGVLQACAAAGWSCALAERRALAVGTSSRSSKLIHGGLRYLESFQLSLVRESLRERAILLGVAPELVRLVPFHVPVFEDTTRGPWTLRAGLSLYALLGGLGRDARFTSLPRREWDGLDGLSTDGLRAVFRYRDGQTDDAELSRAVAASAESLGAEVWCPAELVAARRTPAGWRARLAGEGGEREVTARALVNAAGPWVETVRARLEPTPPGRAVELVGGAHIEVGGTLERGIYYTEAPSDRRAVFVMPWRGHTLVGTTETPYTGDPALVEPEPREVDYLLAVLERYFPDHPREVRAAWAGLRVLPKGEGRAFSRPRETLLAVDEARTPSFVGIYGGKLTGYRATAEKVRRLLERGLGPAPRRGDTAELPLRPAGGPPPPLVP